MIITQLIYLNDGGEKDFLEYESIVLPLLEKYGGKLMFRIRTARESFVYPAEGELPYEVHIISFETKDDFLRFKSDPVRAEHLHLGIGSIKKIILFEAGA